MLSFLFVCLGSLGSRRSRSFWYLAAQVVASIHRMATEPDVPVGHIGGPPLYGRMMSSISSGHDWANRIRMVKLPLIFTDHRLCACS